MRPIREQIEISRKCDIARERIFSFAALVSEFQQSSLKQKSITASNV